MDVFDLEGRSALHLAAEHGSIEVCEALLNKNAFVNSKSKTGWTRWGTITEEAFIIDVTQFFYCPPLPHVILQWLFYLQLCE